MYYQTKKLLLLLIITLFFLSCGSQDRVHSGDVVVSESVVINDSFSSAFEQDEKDFLYNLFLTEYYWSEHTPRPFNSVLYTDPQTMIDTLSYTPLDRWSYVSVGANSYGLYEQTTYGYGFYPKFDIYGNFRIALVDINSPADRAGFQRGDIIVSINTEPPSQEVFENAVGQKGKVTTFEIHRDGIDIYLSLSPQYYNYNVAKGSIVTTNLGKSVGYLRFDRFSDDATQEIEPIFDEFYKNEIDTLVIDMRYNGGGYLNTASILLDKLVRDRDGAVQFRSIWNSANSDKNSVNTFETDSNSLDLKEVLFLVTNESASASETVINALSASSLGVSVALIGSTTHGKPVGRIGRIYNDNIYYLINFKVENSDGFSDYFNGLAVTCPTIDDISREMGDTNETMLKQALYYVDNRGC